MKKLWLPLALLPGIAMAQSSPGFVTGQVPSASQWNSYFAGKIDLSTLGYANGPAQLNGSGVLPPMQGGTGNAGITGWLYGNGTAAVTAYAAIPNNAISTGNRTVTGTTDSISTTDNLGIVDYNAGSSNVAVTLPCTTTPMQTHLYVTAASTGTVTVTAASTACKLNGTANGYVNLAVHTGYTLTMDYNPGSAAEWDIK